MKYKYDLILFDLDGTLLDTSPGIFNSVRYAEAKMGFPRIAEHMLAAFVGPPPKTMYRKIYTVDEETALMAVQYHREYGREYAIYEAEKYPEIIDLLKLLKKARLKLGVATLKSQPIAEKILKVHKLYKYFDCIVGMDANETFSKKDTIHIAIERTNSNNAVLIGDSQYDYDGAREAGIDFIGVLYGFGLQNSTDMFPTVSTPLEILNLI